MSDLMLLVRFFSREQVVTKYGINPDFEEEFFEGCPVAFRSCGKPVFRESDVDEYVRHFRAPPYKHPSRRKGGKPFANDEIAAFAARLRDERKDWKEVAAEVNKQFPPAGNKKRSPDSMRKRVERYRIRQG